MDCKYIVLDLKEKKDSERSEGFYGFTTFILIYFFLL